MAIDLSKMQAKLKAVTEKPTKKTTVFWSPKEGTAYNVRVLPTPDGDPFKEYWFHYDLSKQGGFLCPKKNFGESCAACDFASKLYREKTEESAKMAKKFLARQRFFSAVVVRGEESEGVKVWGYGKTAYQDLIGLVLNPDYGDITDPEEGRDLNLVANKNPGQSYPITKITARVKTSKLCNSETQCKEFMDGLPDFDAIHNRKTSQEVEGILDEYLATDHTEEETEKSSTETVKFGAKPVAKPAAKKSNPVDDAFAELGLDS
jgi:hypothetical protein